MWNQPKRNKSSFNVDALAHTHTHTCVFNGSRKCHLILTQSNPFVSISTANFAHIFSNFVECPVFFLKYVNVFITHFNGNHQTIVRNSNEPHSNDFNWWLIPDSAEAAPIIRSNPSVHFDELHFQLPTNGWVRDRVTIVIGWAIESDREWIDVQVILLIDHNDFSHDAHCVGIRHHFERL